jgi:hypothetical protein
MFQTLDAIDEIERSIWIGKGMVEIADLKGQIRDRKIGGVDVTT